MTGPRIVTANTPPAPPAPRAPRATGRKPNERPTNRHRANGGAANGGPTNGKDPRAFLEDAYQQRLRRSGKTVDHPVAVAELLRDARAPQRVVLAGLLHDLLEDTTVSTAELRERFGGEVAQLVEAVTEDPSIGDLRARKAALRRQVLAAGPAAATIAIADKAAKLTCDYCPGEPSLEHYRETLEGVERRYGHSGLSGLLREKLARCEGTAGS